MNGNYRSQHRSSQFSAGLPPDSPNQEQSYYSTSARQSSHHVTNTSSTTSKSRAPSASDYSMPPMTSSTSSANQSSSSVNQLADELRQTHLAPENSNLPACNNPRQYQDHSSTQQSYNNDAHSQYSHHKSSSRHMMSNGEHHQSQHEADLADYANQIRQSQYKHRYHQQQQQQPMTQLSHHQSSSSSSHNNNNNSMMSSGYNSKQQVNNHTNEYSAPRINYQPAPSAKQQQQQQPHVNFNRCSRVNTHSGDNCDLEDIESQPGRKKKYLTAKYGQQQMNLIKKRLKVEMWLCEQLKALAKGTKSEDELEEVDIDLDEILDLEDDESRRQWIRKILQPYDDLPKDRLDRFICDVIEQSKSL